MWLVLTSTKPSTEANHCFINGKVSMRKILFLEFFSSFSTKDFTLSIFLGFCVLDTHAGTMADMQQPEDLLKAISGYQSAKERYLTNLRSLPVVLNLRYLDDVHVDSE